eukprot:TRINITY_DN2139_c0_g1_i1.p1 TRINITY_DN2139_c0_g1~~TRINITY_DN2139_c0_g1_i1.p1  ORF type:complete len:351 (+),score=92.31 TRINITY_DN2139_c0_g1_i1:1403-2455(+)
MNRETTIYPRLEEGSSGIWPEGSINGLEDLYQRVSDGLSMFAPEMVEEGLNGTYFLYDVNGEIAAVFKPTDEEGNSKNNRKRSDSDQFDERGLIEGEAAFREVAAYILDSSDGGFAGVPRTGLFRIRHSSFGSNEDGTILEKLGSLQEFVINEGASWDVGYSVFPIRQVHKIGIFDLRIFNNDRHGGNILLTTNDEDSYVLVPIDHGFSMSPNLGHAWFDWLNWPQAKLPFSQEEKDYISRIDVEKDIEKIASLNIRKECLNTIRVSTMLLKKGCQYNLSLFDIGTIASRSDPESPSELEVWYARAMKEMGLVDGQFESIKEEMEFLEILSSIMDLNMSSKYAVQPKHVN